MCHLGSAAKSVSAKSLTFKSVKLSVLQPIFNFVHFLCKYFWLFWLLRDFVRFFQLSVTLGLWLPQQWLLRHPLEWQVAYLWSGTPQPVKQPFSSRRSNQSTNNKQASKSDISAATKWDQNQHKFWHLFQDQFPIQLLSHHQDEEELCREEHFMTKAAHCKDLLDPEQRCV